MTKDSSLESAFDQILEKIVDDWYDNVSSYYVTREEIETNPDLKNAREELKRFHDEKGHRIKFSKEDLDFTYGLHCGWNGDDFVIEISVNNKVQAFDYDGLQTRLNEHYEKSGRELVSSPYELRKSTYQKIFQFRPDLKGAFSVEKRKERADIMRLQFWIEAKHLSKLAARPVAGKQLVEHYCISPFRSVYATIYRRSTR